MYELVEVIGIALLGIILLPLIVALIRRKRLVTVQKKLAFLIVLMAVFEIGSYLLWYNVINNHRLYHFYSIFEFWLILNIFRSNLGKWFSTGVVFTLGIGFALFAIGNMLFLQSLFEFNSNVTTASGVMIILLCLISFYELLNAPTYSALYLNPLFWISAGFVLYFSSNLVLFYLSNRVNLTAEEGLIIWGLHSFFNCILILFYTIALWIQPKTD